jgi:hypothetical protein
MIYPDTMNYIKNKKWLLATIMLVPVTLIHAQEPDDSQKIEEFKAALNREFTKITTGTAFSSLGSYASVATDDKSFTLGGSIVQNKSVFAFEVSGGATEGILKIMDKEELNSNININLKYNRLLEIHSGARDDVAVAGIDKEIKDLHTQFSKDSLAIIKKIELHKTQIDLINARQKLEKKQKLLAAMYLLVNSDSIPQSEKESLKLEKELLTYEIGEIINDTIDLSRALEIILKDTTAYFLDKLEILCQTNDIKLAELEKKKKELPILEFDFTWLSFGYKGNNNCFTLLDQIDPVNNRLIDTGFIGHRFTVAFSRYRRTLLQKHDIFWSAGIHFDYTSSFEELSKVTIEERKPFPGDTLKQIVKVINAYKGDYEEGITEVTLFYDWYRCYGLNNTFIWLHFNPYININNTFIKPIAGLVIGIILPFEDEKKLSSKLNVEFFYNRKDVFNLIGNRYSYIGVRATLPINPKNIRS